MIDAQSILQYILKHRERVGVLKNWNEQQILNLIYTGILNNALLVHTATPESTDIEGVVCCYAPNHSAMELHVACIISTSPYGLSSFIARFQQLFPNYTLTAKRRGKSVRYNTNRLCELVLKRTSALH